MLESPSMFHTTLLFTAVALVSGCDEKGAHHTDTEVEQDSVAPEPSCGDDLCDNEENCWSCASDCGDCDCPIQTEVIFYTASAWDVLATALLAEPCPCADYYISIPASGGDKTTPRGNNEPERIRERGPRLHAMAEFHWQTWKHDSRPWYDKGVEFRQRMFDAGYDVDAGDTWAINELPSTIRTDPEVRTNALELFRGLYEGPSNSPPSAGTVFVINLGHRTENFSEYRGNLKDWLQEESFWQEANQYVRFWGQEVYTDPAFTCVPDSLTGTRSNYINAYTQHFARFAEVGPDSAGAARSYMDNAYTPLMNAAWKARTGFGDTQITLEEMKHHVSGQVYAARAWRNQHDYPDGRLGFAWLRGIEPDGESVNIDELEELALRLARSIRYAYGEEGGSASHACSSTGAYTWCQCSVTGAAFNDEWSTFENW